MLRLIVTRIAFASAALASACLSSSAMAQDVAGSCDRGCLEATTRAYLDALIANRPDDAPLSSQVKYTENQELVEIGQGLWQTAVSLGEYQMIISDVRRGQTAYLGIIETDAGQSMLAVRLRIQNGEITEVETIIPGPAAANGTFDLGEGAGNLGHARPAFTTDLLPSERRDRWQLVQSADLHYVGIDRGSGDIVPFGENCIKIENGVQLIRNPDFDSPVTSPAGVDLPNYQAMGCQDQFNTHVWDTDQVTDMRYPVVDEERGVVVAFIMYHQYIKGPCAYVIDFGPACPNQAVEPYTLAAVEAFRVRDGLIEEVEAIFTVLPELRLRGLW